MIVRRVEALGSFLDTDDGKNLLAGYKRAANIVRAEEKKEKGADFSGAYDPALFALDEEKALAAALHAAQIGTPPPPSRAKTSPPPWPRCRICARRSTRSSKR